eukprot:149636-Hanusia_phi.AAC.4
MSLLEITGKKSLPTSFISRLHSPSVCNALNKRNSRTLGEVVLDLSKLQEHQGTVIQHDFDIILTMEDEDNEGRAQNGTLRLFLHYVDAANVHRLFEQQQPALGLNSQLIAVNDDEMMQGNDLPSNEAELKEEASNQLSREGPATERKSSSFQRIPSTFSVASSAFDNLTEFARTSSNFSTAMSSSQTWDTESGLESFYQSSSQGVPWLQGTRSNRQPSNGFERTSSSQGDRKSGRQSRESQKLSNTYVNRQNAEPLNMKHENDLSLQRSSEAQDDLLMSVAILDAHHLPVLHGCGKHLHLYTYLNILESTPGGFIVNLQHSTEISDSADSPQFDEQFLFDVSKKVLKNRDSRPDSVDAVVGMTSLIPVSSPLNRRDCSWFLSSR